MFPDEPSEAEPEDPGAEAESVEFDVTSGEDLVGALPNESEVPSGVKKSFWLVVFTLNVAIGASAIGAMVVFFWGWYQRGLALLVVGAAFFGLAFWRAYLFLEAADSD